MSNTTNNSEEESLFQHIPFPIINLDKLKENEYRIVDDGSIYLLKQFLVNEFNIFIYTELVDCTSPFCGLFEPIDFFIFLYDKYDFLLNNYKNYLKIKNYFSTLNLNEHQEAYFLLRLMFLTHSNEVNNPWIRESDTYRSSINYLIERGKAAEMKVLESQGIPIIEHDLYYGFWFVQAEADQIKDLNNRISYYQYQILEFRQKCLGATSFSDPDFIEKCELEIEKIKIEKTFSNNNSTIDNSSDKNKVGSPVKFTHREYALAHAYKVEANIAKSMTREEMRKSGGKGREKAFDSINPFSKAHIPTKAKELENVIELLHDDQTAQKLAVNALDKLENEL